MPTVCLVVALGVFFDPRSVHAQTGLDESEEIVYIDGVGFIRVLDLEHTGGGQRVNWRSEENDWRDFVLGDFNGDGDAEIAAIRTDGDVGRLVIFDPVVASGEVVPGQRIDGIPWKVLCDLPLEGTPTRIAAGEFNAAVTGDELIVGATTSADDADGVGPYLVTLLHRTGGTADCPWSAMFDAREFGNSWNLIDAANLDHEDMDDVILLDDDESILAVYRIDNGLDETTDRIMNFESDSKKWRDAAPGRYQTTLEQLAAVRTSPLGLPSLLVMQYRNVDETWVDTYTQDFAPNPRVVFPADLDGNGDDEIIMMREVPSNINSPRIFMRNPAGADLPPFEQPLDTDNGFRNGAAGDLDGDGNDEIVIVRSLQMRLYLQPNASDEATRYDFESFATSTNERSIQIADLDAIGYISRPFLAAQPAQLAARLVEGEVSEAIPVRVTEPSGSQELDFTVDLSGKPAWARVTPSTGGTTPATLYVTFDASLLFPGTYASSLVLATVSSDVLTNTLTVPLHLTVTRGVFVSPATVTVLHDCNAGADPVTVDVAVRGSRGRAFTAGIDPVGGVAPAWVNVAPDAGITPATLTLTVDPTQRPAGAPPATLLVAVEADELEDDTLLRVPVALVCVDARVWLPLIAR